MPQDADEPGSIIADAMGSPLQWELIFRLNQSLELTDGIRYLCDIVSSLADQPEYLDAAVRADSEPSSQQISQDRRTELRHWIETNLDTLTRELHGQPIDTSVADGMSLADIMANPFGFLQQFVDFRPLLEPLLGLTRQIPARTANEAVYALTYLRYRSSLPLAPTLSRALFVTTVSSIEPVVSRFVQILLQRRDPIAFPSLADENLEQEVYKRCFGPPAKWRKVLVDGLGISKADDVIDWPALDALWEDRNIVVHRDGLVDKRHSLKSGVERGRLVHPTLDDVRETADFVGGIRYVLTLVVWDELRPGIGPVIASESEILSSSFLRSKRWALAAAFANAEAVFASDDISLATAKVNRWLASQRGHDVERTRTEVEQWVVSQLPPHFALAKEILLGNDRAACSLLAQLKGAGDVGDAEVEEWPIFDRLRRQKLI